MNHMLIRQQYTKLIISPLFISRRARASNIDNDNIIW